MNLERTECLLETFWRMIPLGSESQWFVVTGVDHWRMINFNGQKAQSHTTESLIELNMGVSRRSPRVGRVVGALSLGVESKH